VKKWCTMVSLDALLIGVVLGCATGPAVRAERERHASPAGTALDTTKLDGFLARACGEWSEGCSLQLVRDHETLYDRSFGGFDRRKPIPIASATKWLTGAVVLTLVDEGKLGLDDSASRYLPEFGGGKARITVRQLLSHMSGLPMSDPALQRRDITLKQSVEAIASAPLMSAPGEVCVYGDASVQVAGRIAEIASRTGAPSGRAWKALFAARLAGPLEMTGTSYDGPIPTDNPHLAGGAFSTVSDYTNFLVMLSNGGQFRGRRILSEKAVKEMFRDQTAGKPLRFNPFQSFADLRPDWREVRYGICNWLERIDSGSGRTLEASAPGIFGFCPWIDFENKVVGVLAAESGMQKSLPVYLELKTLISQK
jgi:serine-type D-Ala-D-Ala carboxypeptidase/endopeptidase